MRVISGTARGTKLSSIESIKTRPTLDRVKESLFNILQDKIKDKIILDLFAGSGALGIEALSRGAQKAYFCDINYDAIKILKQNLDKTKLTQKAIIINKDYKIALKQIPDKIDIAFLDPPYKMDFAINSIKQMLNLNLISKESLLIVETDEITRDIEEIEKITDLEIIDKRKYGRANLIFIKKRGN